MWQHYWLSGRLQLARLVMKPSSQIGHSLVWSISIEWIPEPRLRSWNTASYCQSMMSKYRKKKVLQTWHEKFTSNTKNEDLIRSCSCYDLLVFLSISIPRTHGLFAQTIRRFPYHDTDSVLWRHWVAARWTPNKRKQKQRHCRRNIPRTITNHDNRKYQTNIRNYRMDAWVRQTKSKKIICYWSILLINTGLDLPCGPMPELPCMDCMDRWNLIVSRAWHGISTRRLAIRIRWATLEDDFGEPPRWARKAGIMLAFSGESDVVMMMRKTRQIMIGWGWQHFGSLFKLIQRSEEVWGALKLPEAGHTSLYWLTKHASHNITIGLDANSQWGTTAWCTFGVFNKVR